MTARMVAGSNLRCQPVSEINKLPEVLMSWKSWIHAIENIVNIMVYNMCVINSNSWDGKRWVRWDRGKEGEGRLSILYCYYHPVFPYLQRKRRLTRWMWILVSEVDLLTEGYCILTEDSCANVVIGERINFCVRYDTTEAKCLLYDH